jgi:hypothetical protein
MGSILIGNFIEDTKPSLSLIKFDADNETLTGEALDMTGYQGVLFIVAAQKGEAANYTLKAQQDTVVGFGGAADLLGSSVAFSTAIGTDGLACLEIHNPKEAFVRPVLVVPNVTTPTAVCVMALRYGKNWRPETTPNTEFHEAPAEGTA